MADDGEAAEVALERGAPLVHKVVPLHDLPLDDALVGPRRHEEAALGLREAVGRQAPSHAELAAVGHPSGDEVGDVAGRAGNDAHGSGRGLGVLPRLRDNDLSKPWPRLAGLPRGRSDVGSRGRREIIHPVLILLVQKRAVVLAAGGTGRGVSWPILDSTMTKETVGWTRVFGVCIVDLNIIALCKQM
jgi:hypothetical protein